MIWVNRVVRTKLKKNYKIREPQMKKIRAENFYINDNDETIENNI